MICPAKSAQELLSEFRTTGSQQPFEEIVRRYAAMVFHVCFGILKNRHDAEDATQAVFLTLAVQGKTSKEIHAIGPWLQQVARRLSLDLKKSRKRRAAREQKHGILSIDANAKLPINSTLDHQELRHILSEELNQLAPKYRLPLILHYFGGLSREQMSQELGCKPATLGVRLHRGREMLAARLSQRGVALSVAGLGLLLSYIVREAVSESMVWSTSHVASQMAIGNPINPALISSRAMSLARSAAGTLAVAKIKGLVAAVLVAATAVAAGAQIVSKTHTVDINLDGPACELLRELLHPKLPRFQSDAAPIDSPQIEKSANPVATTQKEIITPREFPTLMSQPSGAAWGGSTQISQWIPSSTSTRIPGIIWSSSATPAENSRFIFTFTSPTYASDQIATPVARPPYRSWRGGGSSTAMARSIPEKPLTQPEPDNSKPKRRDSRPPPPITIPNNAPTVHNELVANPEPRLYLDPTPSGIMTGPYVSQPSSPPANPSPTRFVTIPTPTLVIAAGDGQSLASAIVNQINKTSSPLQLVDRSPIRVRSTASAFDYAGINSLSFSLSADSAVADRGVDLDSVSYSTAGTAQNVNTYVAVQSITLAVTATATGASEFVIVGSVPRTQLATNLPQSDRDPVGLAHTAFVDDIPSSTSVGSGMLRGYGTAKAAAELDQNGQMIADGYGQNRTLDLSAIGRIKNSKDNPASGQNGWFAQHHGKLVLPSVHFAGGAATWGEDPTDNRLDLVNSVRLHASPDLVGEIKLALLSTDRTDYPSLPANLKAVGLWHLEDVDFVLGDVDLTIRYDAALASDLRVSNKLNLWGYDGHWHLADDISIDPANRWISGQLSGVSYFAVAGSTSRFTYISSTPEPGSLLALAAAGFLLKRRRRPAGC